MAVLFTNHFVQFFDANGDPLSNGKLYAYSAGTTTPKPTYTTEEGDIENAHPIVLDSAGRATIFIQGSYRFDLFDQNDVLIKSTDDVTSFTTLNESGEPFFQSFSGNGTQTVFTLSESLGSDSKDVMVFVDNGRPNYVVNGDFATDTVWTKGTGWTIGSGVATATGAISTALTQTSDITLVENQTYVLTYTITRSAGGIIPSIGGRNGVERTATGTYSEIINAGSTQAIAFTGNGFTGTVDNVTIKQSGVTGYEVQNPNAYTLSGTSLTFNTAPETGTNNIYVFAPSKLLGEAAASAAEAAASATAAASSASAAAASAATLDIESTTSNTIGTGSKTFTVAGSLGLLAGQWVVILSDANPTVNYMTGQITSYSSTTLIINVTQAFGSGTLNDWTIKLSGVEGAQGETGSLSDISGVSTATPTLSDTAIFTDVDDSNNTKKATLSNILGLNVIDEDDMASDSDTKVPTQQSVKAYVDNSGADPVSGALLQYQLANGTDSTAITAGSWQTVPLNTEVYDAGNIVTLSSNQFTLGAGTYKITGFVSNGGTGSSADARMRIRNITDSTTPFQGPNYSTPTNTASSPAMGYVTIAGTKTFELQFFQTTQSGVSPAVSTGEVEVYHYVAIEKLS